MASWIGSVRRAVALGVAAVLVVGFVGVASPTPSVADAPNVVSASGITVLGWRWITWRTLEVDISTEGRGRAHRRTAPGAHHAADELLPGPDDSLPGPVPAHGGAGANSAQWTTGGGEVEPITNATPHHRHARRRQGRLVHELAQPDRWASAMGRLPPHPAIAWSTPTSAPSPQSGPSDRRALDGWLRSHPLRAGPARPVRVRPRASRARSTSETRGSARPSRSSRSSTGSPRTARSVHRGGPPTYVERAQSAHRAADCKG